MEAKKVITHQFGHAKREGDVIAALSPMLNTTGSNSHLTRFLTSRNFITRFTGCEQCQRELSVAFQLRSRQPTGFHDGKTGDEWLRHTEFWRNVLFYARNISSFRHLCRQADNEFRVASAACLTPTIPIFAAPLAWHGMPFPQFAVIP